MLSCCSSCPRIPVGCSAHVPVAKSPTFSAASEACATGPLRTRAVAARGLAHFSHNSCAKSGLVHGGLPAWRLLASSHDENERDQAKHDQGEDREDRKSTRLNS